MLLTPGKLLPFKLAFSRLSLSDGNWARLFTSFGSDIITKIFLWAAMTILFSLAVQIYFHLSPYI